jgi:hypothetical protein
MRGDQWPSNESIFFFEQFSTDCLVVAINAITHEVYLLNWHEDTNHGVIL